VISSAPAMKHSLVVEVVNCTCTSQEQQRACRPNRILLQPKEPAKLGSGFQQSSYLGQEIDEGTLARSRAAPPAGRGQSPDWVPAGGVGHWPKARVEP